MKNFVSAALLACIVVGQGHVTVIKEAAAASDEQMKPQPVEPDMSEFPDEWTKPCGEDTKCSAAPVQPTW